MNNIEIQIKKEPLFQELWFEGSITYKEKEYKFWLIDPKGKDEEGKEYEEEIRWFYKQVPMEVRRMSGEIINMYKERK
jgi:hypothetical protein